MLVVPTVAGGTRPGRSGAAWSRRTGSAARRRISPALVGREQEAARLRALVLDRAARLVTLTGPGGVGKTRLAVQVAADLDAGFDEVAFVEFAPVRDHDRVAARIAEALGVVESPGQSPGTALVRALGPRKLLLVLDNFEHVLAAGPVLVD